jgi:hypothetical protein
MNKTSVAQQTKTASFLPPAQGILQRKCAFDNQIRWAHPTIFPATFGNSRAYFFVSGTFRSTNR